MDHSASSGPRGDRFRTVGKPKGRRGQITCPRPPGEQPLIEGKGHLPRAPQTSSLWRRKLCALLRPRGRVCKLCCPARLSPGPGERAPPGRAFPASLGAGLSQPPPGTGDQREPAAPRVPCGGAAPRCPALLKANFSAGALYLFGGFAAAQPAVSAAHPPPGAPGRRLPTPGPPEDPAVPAPLPAPRLPARAAGETLKLNLKAQP